MSTLFAEVSDGYAAPVFQGVVIGVLAILLLRDLWKWSRPPGKFVRMLRCLVWIGTGIAIAEPQWVQDAASALGIGRAADAVLYVFVLAFLWVSFFLYARCLKLERQITSLTRHIAIREAEKGPAEKI